MTLIRSSVDVKSLDALIRRKTAKVAIQRLELAATRVPDIGRETADSFDVGSIERGEDRRSEGVAGRARYRDSFSGFVQSQSGDFPIALIVKNNHKWARSIEHGRSTVYTVPSAPNLTNGKTFLKWPVNNVAGPPFITSNRAVRPGTYVGKPVIKTTIRRAIRSVR